MLGAGTIELLGVRTGGATAAGTVGGPAVLPFAVATRRIAHVYVVFKLVDPEVEVRGQASPTSWLKPIVTPSVSPTCTPAWPKRLVSRSRRSAPTSPRADRSLPTRHGRRPGRRSRKDPQLGPLSLCLAHSEAMDRSRSSLSRPSGGQQPGERAEHGRCDHDADDGADRYRDGAQRRLREGRCGGNPEQDADGHAQHCAEEGDGHRLRQHHLPVLGVSASRQRGGGRSPAPARGPRAPGCWRSPSAR